MEFEKDAPVSEEQRQLADSRKLTLQPVHTGIQPEDVSESQIANSHINGQPIGNIHTDIEQEAPVLQQAAKPSTEPTHEAKRQSKMIIMASAGAGIVLVITSMILIYSITN